LTQEQVALLLGTDLKWYQRVEWRKKDVRASTIERLAAVFGISALEFLSKEPPKTKVTSHPPGAPHKPRTRSTLIERRHNKQGRKVAMRKPR
jgi:transcriptional regulator with XRE-family HTH domain